MPIPPALTYTQAYRDRRIAARIGEPVDRSGPTGSEAVFAPSPQLTVTVEEIEGVPDVHMHAGGQRVWQSRMIESLGAAYVHDRPESGARVVVVSRAAEDALALVEDELWLVESPELTPVDPRGGGDSMTAGPAVGLAQGLSPRQALELGAANVTRHSLGSSSGEAVRELAGPVRLKNWEDAA